MAELQQYWPLLAAFVVGYIASQKGIKIPILSQESRASAPAAVFAPPGTANPFKVSLETADGSVAVDGGTVQITKKG